MDKTTLQKLKAATVEDAKRWFDKQRRRRDIDPSDLMGFNIRKIFSRTTYSRHQGNSERERRLRQYPSLDLSRQGH
jgi:hypothetical protein